MSVWKRTALACALTAIFPGVALAQSNEDLLKELKALQARVGELEKKIEAADANGGSPQWGMTRDQVHELNRVAVQSDGQSDAMEAQGLKDLKISGMLDPTYVWTQSNGGSFAFLNGFTGNGGDLSYPNDSFGYDNSYFGQAMLDFQKQTEDGTRWRLTLAPQKNASSGYNIGSIVHEASVSVALTDEKTRLWAGQIPDWSGYEYVWSNQQPLISHNLLFDFTLPSFYTGAALDLTRGNWETKLLVGNLNASRYDHANSAPVFAYRADYSMGEYSGIGFAGVNGKSFGNRIDTFELDGYFIRGDWTLQGQFGIGRLKNGAASGDAKWTGLSGLVGYNFTPRFKGTVRADYIKNDANGGGIFGSAPVMRPEHRRLYHRWPQRLRPEDDVRRRVLHVDRRPERQGSEPLRADHRRELPLRHEHDAEAGIPARRRRRPGLPVPGRELQEDEPDAVHLGGRKLLIGRRSRHPRPPHRAAAVTLEGRA